MGTDVTAMFLDEFLFMEPKAFPSILPPSATGAMVVFISSMSANTASTAMRILDGVYDDGSPVVRKFNLVQVSSSSSSSSLLLFLFFTSHVWSVNALVGLISVHISLKHHNISIQLPVRHD
jgi:hypothetical protein